MTKVIEWRITGQGGSYLNSVCRWGNLQVVRRTDSWTYTMTAHGSHRLIACGKLQGARRSIAAAEARLLCEEALDAKAS